MQQQSVATPLERLPARLLARVRIDPETNCWLWTGALTSGYGHLRVRGQDYYAHRYIYELTVGPILPSNPRIYHRCGVCRCVNPDHLYAAISPDYVQEVPITMRERFAALSARVLKLLQCY